MYGKAMYATSASYAWAPLMFFMLMGYFCFYGDFGKDLYTCARRWLGHLRGGLAQGSVCACAAFGAVVGDVLSGSIAMSAIALPEMRNNRYDDTLAVGHAGLFLHHRRADSAFHHVHSLWCAGRAVHRGSVHGRSLSRPHLHLFLHAGDLGHGVPQAGTCAASAQGTACRSSGFAPRGLSDHRAVRAGHRRHLRAECSPPPKAAASARRAR